MGLRIFRIALSNTHRLHTGEGDTLMNNEIEALFRAHLEQTNRETEVIKEIMLIIAKMKEDRADAYEMISHLANNVRASDPDLSSQSMALSERLEAVSSEIQRALSSGTKPRSEMPPSSPVPPAPVPSNGSARSVQNGNGSSPPFPIPELNAGAPTE